MKTVNENNTTRQQALQMLAAGATPREISETLNVPPATVRTWKSRNATQSQHEPKQPETHEFEEQNENRREPYFPQQQFDENNDTETSFQKLDRATIILIIVVMLLCFASIHSVFLVFVRVFASAFTAFVLSAVACLSPITLIIYSQQRNEITATLQIVSTVTFIIAFTIETTCNVIAIAEQIQYSATLINSVSETLNLKRVAYSWFVGISLPTLALCFEVLLLRPQQQTLHNVT